MPFGIALFLGGEESVMIQQKRLRLYQMDIKYIRELSHVDDHVMSVSPQIGKSNRPFIGIIIVCNEKKYCVPLSSPKEKHQTMKNDIDFMKITGDEKLIGVLNFNNMIPVHEKFIRLLSLKITPKDSREMIAYKRLAAKQLDFCQQHQDIIIKKANRLYKMIVENRAGALLKKRCCDFYRLEQRLHELSTKI